MHGNSFQYRLNLKLLETISVEPLEYFIHRGNAQAFS
jgi:hypothetical protein